MKYKYVGQFTEQDIDAGRDRIEKFVLRKVCEHEECPYTFCKWNQYYNPEEAMPSWFCCHEDYVPFVTVDSCMAYLDI